MATERENRIAPWKLRLAFALAPVTHATGANIVTILALRYLTDNMGMAPSVAGLLFGLVKIYDGLIDPLLGTISDRLDTRIGRRLPFLLGGSLLMAVSIVALFAAPASLSPVALWIYAAVILMIHATAYTALTIPGLAMVVEVADNYHERSTLMSYRIVGNSAGLLLGSALPAWLLANWGADRIGHIRAAAVAGVIVVACGVVATLLLLNAKRTKNTSGKKRLRLADFGDQFRVAWKNKPYRLLAIAHIFVLLAVMTPSVTSAYFTRYALKLSDAWLGNYFMVTIVGLVLAIPVWLQVAKRVDKKHCYIAAMIIYGLIHFTWLTSGPGEHVALLFIRSVVSGIGGAGLMLFAYSMLTDAIRYDYVVTGHRREGAFAGVTSLLDKMSMAGAIAGIGILLSAMGYQASASGGAIEQSATAVQAIYIGFAVIPGIALIGAAVAIWGYRLSEADLEEPDIAPQPQVT